MEFKIERAYEEKLDIYKEVLDLYEAEYFSYYFDEEDKDGEHYAKIKLNKIEDIVNLSEKIGKKLIIEKESVIVIYDNYLE